jgi:DNA adenine methylase
MKKILAFSYFGGKYYMLDWLYSHFPEHHTFVDVFGGSGVVTFNKKPSKVDVYNDLNSEIYNFFKVLREKPKTLQYLLATSPYSREEYKNSKNREDISDVEKARRFFVNISQSFSGVLNNQWAYDVNRSCHNMSSVVSRFLSKIHINLPEIIMVLNRIQLENRDFQDIIRLYDSEDTFFYCDPPYLQSTRTFSHEYTHEMSLNKHIELSVLLNKIKGKFLLSGYNSKIYDSLYKNCNKSTKDVVNKSTVKSNNQKCEPRTEVLWYNYKISEKN